MTPQSGPLVAALTICANSCALHCIYWSCSGVLNGGQLCHVAIETILFRADDFFFLLHGAWLTLQTPMLDADDAFFCDLIFPGRCIWQGRSKRLEVGNQFLRWPSALFGLSLGLLNARYESRTLDYSLIFLACTESALKCRVGASDWIRRGCAGFGGAGAEG